MPGARRVGGGGGELAGVDDEGFRDFVDGLVRRGVGRGARCGDRFDSGDPSLVSADGHATLVGVNIGGEDAAGEVIDAVERADADPDFAVAVTGSTTRDHDFNELSERDLLNVELRLLLRTALAVVGGYLLAGELAAAGDHSSAFAAYERRMRPYIAQGQQLPPGGIRGFAPRTRMGIRAVRMSMASTRRWPMRSILEKQFQKADAVTLPDESWPAA